MKILKFKEPVRFQIQKVHTYDNVWHLEGVFLTGKFQNPRKLRAEPDERWYGAEEVELPGKELREVGGAIGHEGKRQSYRPIYSGELFVSPRDGDRFVFNEVKVLAFHPIEKIRLQSRIDRLIDTCPVCKNRLVIRSYFDRSFIGCSSYPNCHYSRNGWEDFISRKSNHAEENAKLQQELNALKKELTG